MSNRQLIATNQFERKLSNLSQKGVDLKKKISKTLNLLKKDVYSSVLRTHKLSGKLKNLYACSIDYDYRIVFVFDAEFVYLLNIGTHEEVY